MADSEARGEKGTRGIPARAAHSPDRREFLGTIGMLPVLGMVPSCLVPEEQTARVDAMTGPTIITQADRKEYSRLKKLDLEDPEVVAKRREMPVGKIGPLTLGRLVSGSNLISMNMHARDLEYVSDLAAHYNTAERIFMTLKKCEENGIDAIVLKSHNFSRFPLKTYWSEWGGKMRWIADVITTDVDQFERILVEHLELGAAAAYVWGGASDIWYHEKRPQNIVKAFELIRKYKVPAGICAHRLEPLVFCEKEGLKPDFYMKTLHHDRYWSAHPPEKRRYLEMYEKESEDHSEYHDNLFCGDAEETVAFMREVKVPWIAFKILAAGAIPPADGFRYAFEGGADFVCVGMFDFQIEADVKILKESVERAKARDRSWA